MVAAADESFNLVPNGHAVNYPRPRNGLTNTNIQESSKIVQNGSIHTENGSLHNGNGSLLNGKKSLSNRNGVLSHSVKKQSLSVTSRLSSMLINLFYFFWKHFRRLFMKESCGSKQYQNGNAHRICETYIDPNDWKSMESFEPAPLLIKGLAMLGFVFVMILGAINKALFAPKVASESKNRKDYAPLYNKFDVFYSLYVYRRIRDCWNQPVCSVPGVEIYLKDRITRDYNWSFQFTGTASKCINLGSYNYLGFAEITGACVEKCEETIKKYGVSLCSPSSEYGLSSLHFEIEQLTAKFLGVDDALTCGMGFATNVLNLPCLLSEGCLVLSDEKNHASLILSLRLSAAKSVIFKHNDMKDLEKKLRSGIIKGQPRTKKPWKKIFVVVEGVYSMEGSVVHLPQLIELKKKYKFYLYVDEAHSIGALGPTGRGVTEFFGVDPKQIDILMGTFTKSFSSAGGYIAGSQSLVDYIRRNSHATHYAPSMSPGVIQQVLSTMRIIMGEEGGNEGQRRLRQLRMNVRYFRRRLKQMGVIIYGNDNSPVVPLLVFQLSKVHVLIMEFRKRSIAAVGVGFPATELYMGRLRFCLSAGHTKEQLDKTVAELVSQKKANDRSCGLLRKDVYKFLYMRKNANLSLRSNKPIYHRPSFVKRALVKTLAIIDEFADEFGLRYSNRPRFEGDIVYEDVEF